MQQESHSECEKRQTKTTPCPSPAPSEKSSASDTATPSPCPDPGSEPKSPPLQPSSTSKPTPTALSPLQLSPNPIDLPATTSLIPDQIIVIPDRDGRVAHDAESIRSLADNIAQVGLINPPTVRRVPNGHEMVAGHRRLDALKLLGWPLIPVHVVDADDLRTAEITASENLQRKNLSPMEEAEQLHVLVESHPDAVEGIASQLGRSVDWVLNRLDLLTWPTNLQAALHAGRISIAAASHLARIPDPDLQELRIQHAVAHGCSAATAALWLQDAIASNSQPSNVSHPETEIAPDRILTETTAICFLCGTQTKIEETATRRLCTVCLTTIANSQQSQAQSQQQQPPGLEVTNPIPPPNQRVP